MRALSAPAQATAPRRISTDIEDFRARQRERPQASYENLLDEHAPAAAALIVADGWKLGPFPRVRLQAPLAWDEICAANRSWHFHLQAWDPIATVLAAYDASPNPGYLSWALELAVDWARSFADPERPSPFAFYDMALGVRAYRLAYLIDVCARLDTVSDEDLAWLLSAADMHRELLADDARFAAHSNHGFYQAAGQLALHRRLGALAGMEPVRVQAIGRLRTLMGAHFSAEGIHLEHSPEYQWMLMQSLAGMTGSGLIDDPEVLEMFGLVQASMAWFIAPDGRLAMLGDSTPREPKLRRPEHITDQGLLFSASAGTRGVPPQGSTRLFRDGGYAVLRDRWPQGPDDYRRCSYLAQTCCFHSRVHKHADDMSFVWFDRGREILTDSGRYGYLGAVPVGSELYEQGFHYSDPQRVYVESTRAHNSVEVDGLSHRRRRVPFYGSGVLQAGDANGILYSECELAQTLRHTRVLLLNPRRWLIVYDWLRDAGGEPHDLRQWLQFAPELEVQDAGDQQLLASAEDGTQLRVAPLLEATLGERARGRSEPALGWISREVLSFEPRMTACYEATGVAAQTFATLLTFTDTPVIADFQRSGVDPSGANARLCWQNDGRRHELSIAREPGQPLSVDYRRRRP